MDRLCSRVSKASLHYQYHLHLRTRSEADQFSVCLELGQGPSAHFDDWTIQNAPQVAAYDSLSMELRHALMIQRYSYEAALRWSNTAEGPHGLSGQDECFDIIWQCEKLYDNLLPRLQAQVSLTNCLELQNARLHMQCLYLLCDSQSNSRAPGILRAYSTATDMITTILSDEKCHDVLPFAPQRMSRMIFMAALLILRVLHSTLAADLDYKRGQLLFNAAAFSLRQFSVMQNGRDQPVRASEMLRAFWRAAERSPTMSTQDITLRAKSRMGASLVYDCLLRFRDQSNAMTSAENLASTSSTSAPEPISQPQPEPVQTGSNETDTHVSDHLPHISFSSNDVLNEGTEVDMMNMSWLEDIAYPGFADIEGW